MKGPEAENYQCIVHEQRKELTNECKTNIE